MKENIENDNLNQSEERDELNDMTEDTFNTIKEEKKNQRIIAGFWKRVFAFILDNIFLAGFGAILGIFLGDLFNQMGQSARLIGFIVILLYFGLLNSAKGHGQTIGKRILKIQVVDKEKCFIPIHISVLRTFILFSSVYLTDLIWPLMKFSAVEMILSFLVSGVSIAVFYLYVFNRKTRQSLHDILCGTYVIERSKEGSFDGGKIARVHYVVLVILLVLLPVTPKLFENQIANKLNVNMDNIYELQQRINSEPTINSVSVMDGVNYNINGEKSTYLEISFCWQGSQEESSSVAKKVSNMALDTYPEAAQKDIIRISINSGYDIGIFKWYMIYHYYYSPEEWKNY